MKLSLCLTLSLATPLAAQVKFCNMEIPQGTSVTAIDWFSRPALLIYGGSSSAFVRFQRPDLVPGPAIQLDIQGLGVWDFRTCAQGQSVRLESEDYTLQAPHQSLTMIPPSGLSIITQFMGSMNYWVTPPSYAFMYPWVSYWFDYCPYAGPCGCQGQSVYPSGFALVAYVNAK